ncbi:DUF4936 family protein [Noviherbaspirillum denitrificans]|uniref:DUF4936 domain-containing protein n=1 Tax=Noviherbaspirillum denitrificans TaxID=1968433 RepID=A0A254TBJ4_9BURK|nr:DUF4936 family protein [Noviherbaspirillum denitrificans]OWW20020.1 hypothetical protein AYR66_11460 [Noviherbaspirillum denitrificans]
MDLYIYYRVRGDNAPALHARVTAMQQRIANGVAVALKRRPEEKDGLQTWMEVYLAVPEGFEAILQDAVAKDGLAGLIEGPRHTEHFVDIPACA